MEFGRKFWNKNKHNKTDLITIDHSWDGLHEYAYHLTHILFNNIMVDTINNIVGLDKVVKDSLYTDSTAMYNIQGLVDLLITDFVKCRKSYYIVSVKDGRLLFTKSNQNAIDEEAPDVLKLDFSNNYVSRTIENIYIAIIKILVNAEIRLNLANYPIIKLDKLRETSQQKKEAIEAQVSRVLEALTNKSGSTVYMDSNDSVDLLNFDASQYQGMLQVLYSNIANITRLPIGYINGQFSGGLNSTGEVDTKQIDRVLYGYFQRYFSPLFQRINLIVGITEPFYYRPNIKDKFKDVAGLIQVLETSDILSVEQKQIILKDLLPEIFS